MTTTDHIAIKVNDLTVSTEFYKEALGYQIVDYVDFGEGTTSAYLSLPGESIRIQLIHKENQQIYAKYGHIGLETNDIASLYDKHKENNYEITKLFTLEHQFCYFIKDPDHNEIEIIQKRKKY